MTATKAFITAALLGLVSGAVLPRQYSVPNNDNFPNPDQQQIASIEKKAFGKLPNSPPATKLGANTATAFQLIAVNEQFETAYFASLKNNITNKVAGYETTDPQQFIDVLEAVQAQEELHALGAVSTLQAAGEFAPQPCKYKFPVDNIGDAFAIAETFTAVVLGALQDANVIFAGDGATGPVRLISSVIGQEGEQNGYYRVLLDRLPSESPFLTTVPAAFAFSALQMFIVPGSCPFPLSNINLPIFPSLMTNGGAVALLEPEDQVLTFSADLTGSAAAAPYVGKTDCGLSLTYVTGQQVPISVGIGNVQWNGAVITFEAEFPYTENVMAGFSHASLTTATGFPDADSIVAHTLAAPAVIQVFNKL